MDLTRVAVSEKNDIYVAGRFVDSVFFGDAVYHCRGQYDGIVAKLSTDGEWLWSTTYGTVGDDAITAVALTRNRLVIAAGSFGGHLTLPDGTLHESSGGTDAIVLGLVPEDGSVDWSHAFGGPGEDEATALAVGVDQNVLFGGTFEDTVDFAWHADTEEIRTALGTKRNAFLVNAEP